MILITNIFHRKRGRFNHFSHSCFAIFQLYSMKFAYCIFKGFNLATYRLPLENLSSVDWGTCLTILKAGPLCCTNKISFHFCMIWISVFKSLFLGTGLAWTHDLDLFLRILKPSLTIWWPHGDDCYFLICFGLVWCLVPPSLLPMSHFCKPALQLLIISLLKRALRTGFRAVPFLLI